MKKSRFKKNLLELKRSRVGLHADPAASLFLDRNERIVPYGAETMRRLAERIARVNINLYPDLELFYAKLARWLSVDEGSLYVTEGVSGAIKSLIETIAAPGDNIVFPKPTFALYPVYAQMFGLECRTVGYDGGYGLELQKMKERIDERTAIVFLPNPNVPIEGTLATDQIAALAKHCAERGAFLAVDEVYYLYGGPTAMGLTRDFDNIFVMRSFSKAFGLAGIRVGYIVSAKDNIDYVSKTRTGYETNSVSAAIVSFFIDNYDLVEGYIREVREGLAYLKKEFDRLGLAHNGGNASNFIYADTGNKDVVDRLRLRLKDKDIYIRAGWPEPYASGFSITAGPKKTMEKFIGALEKAL